MRCRDHRESSSGFAAPATALPTTAATPVQAPAGNPFMSCVADHSRVAFSQIYPDETAASATAFLAAALAYYQHLGIQVRRVLTDNGGCYRSRAFNARCLTGWPPPSIHEPLHAPRQRQGGTLHSGCPTRVGLCPRLPHLRRARRASAALDTPLQLAPATRQSQGQAAHQPNRADRGQPVEVPHLAARGESRCC